MKLITLISDWKLRDPYIGMMKGELYKAFPDANVIDITHSIEKNNIMQTAFLLKNSFQSFPDETLHLILTASINSYTSNPVLVKYEKHYFLGDDNGVFSLITENNPIEKAWRFPDSMKEISIPYKMIRMLQWFYESELEQKAEDYPALQRKLISLPDYNAIANVLKGKVVYIDSNCNAVTNIPASLFLEHVAGKRFTAKIGSRQHVKTNKFYKHYQANEDGIYLVINRLGYIEITIKDGALAILTSLQIDDSIEIFIE
ncbi:SAM-dependent chlorinase/fluorinase [Bacteroidales bacterium OttesenSCG-928-B11]|nr:SAM-dependent chlorinase/fluorinase [Bacteroidales bacterium OttesenSCG-928-C03]MDL2312095.1 SAM-dependent chlorinase/fluorinase [Bacteroidales bacterium OttesenSCG-928-B11]MDL2326065.1 SAM-dependent chlorinase/fluorinase [Bacteroidales bacterium OttesenSCG-928-A14]